MYSEHPHLAQQSIRGQIDGSLSQGMGLPFEQKLYLDILVEITLHFIRAEYSSEKN